MTKIPTRLISVVVMLAALSSCGPKPVIEEAAEVAVACYPEQLEVRAGNGSLDVLWKDNCNRLISGYNIYITEQPLVARYPGSELPADIKPFNTEVYPGDTQVEDGIESFPAEGLSNGKPYYVSVRIVYPDRSLSKPSDEVTVVCGPRGEIELGVRYKAEHDGYSLEKNDYVPADDLANDIYFFSKDGKDYLSSPDKLNGFLRQNKFRRLPSKGSFDDVRRQIAAGTAVPADDRVTVAKGDWILLLTADKSTALVNVLDITGMGEERRIRLFYAYNSLPGSMFF